MLTETVNQIIVEVVNNFLKDDARDKYMYSTH